MVIINKQINVLVSFQSLSVPSSLAREAVPSLQTLYLFVVALPLGVFNKNKNKNKNKIKIGSKSDLKQQMKMCASQPLQLPKIKRALVFLIKSWRDVRLAKIMKNSKASK